MISGKKLLILKAIHIALNAITVGGLSAIGILLYLKKSDSRFEFSAHIDQGIYHLLNGIVFYSMIAVLITAIVYALFTRWGLFKWQWIITKWILFFSLMILFIWMFIPAINGLTSLSDSGLHKVVSRVEYSGYTSLAFNLLLLILGIYFVIFIISSLKPFSRNEKDLFSNPVKLRIWVTILTMAISGLCVYGFVYLNKLRKLSINPINASSLMDGEYFGSFDSEGDVYSVSVIINNGKIIAVDHSSDRISKFVRFAEPIIERIIKKQSPDVDAITGATTTSKCIMKAVETALKSEPHLHKLDQ